MSTSPTQVFDSCPAFVDGCPFDAMKLAEILKPADAALERILKETCPAFENGCPFAFTDSVKAIAQKFSEMPHSHCLSDPTSGATKASVHVNDLLQRVHEISQQQQQNIGKCPEFNSEVGCPFRGAKTSAGQLLVQELDAIAGQHWGLDVKPLGETNKSDTAENDGTKLARLLKTGTQRAHRAAENVYFVRDFMRGNVPLESYRELLGGLYHVYAALEEEMRRCAQKDTRVAAVFFPALSRTETLVQDLRHYYAGDQEGLSAALRSPSPAVRDYVAQIRENAISKPLLLVAHAYTRYLGDLSGGQVLAKCASKSYGLKGTAGTQFYEFEQIPDAKKFKVSYRMALDGLAVTEEEADQLVKEANLAFLHNMRIFEERDVAAGVRKRVRTIEEAMELVGSAKSALSFQKAYFGEEAPESKCPFLVVKTKATNVQRSVENVASMGRFKMSCQSTSILGIATMSLVLACSLLVRRQGRSNK